MDIVLLCVTILSVGFGMYCFSALREKQKRLTDRDELIAALKEERTHWQNKALFVQGKSPLGRETEKREPVVHRPQQRIVTRGELEARVTIPDEVVNAKPVTRVVTENHTVAYPRTAETISKAAEILNGKSDKP